MISPIVHKAAMRGMALRLETKPVKPRCAGLRQRFYAQLAHPSKPAIGSVHRVKNLHARPVGYSQAIEAQSPANAAYTVDAGKVVPKTAPRRQYAQKLPRHHARLLGPLPGPVPALI